jgi:cellulose biosynthesis protein BcsQ
VNPIRTLTANIRLELDDLYKGLLFDAEIPIDVRLPESQRLHMPAVIYARTAKGTIAYMHLTEELMRRLE